MEKRVYLVEDIEKNMKLFKAVLNTMPDIEVIAETHGGRAFEFLKADCPDLIILDIQLAEMSGIDICKELRKMDKFKEIPIIAASSSPVEGNRESIFARAGFNKSLSKPLNLKEFKEVIKEFLS